MLAPTTLGLASFNICPQSPPGPPRHGVLDPWLRTPGEGQKPPTRSSFSWPGGGNLARPGLLPGVAAAGWDAQLSPDLGLF